MLLLFSRLTSAAVVVAACGVIWSTVDAADGSRFAHSDSDKRYLHYIDLYDHNNQRITPESDQPYSVRNTCGRCHDYDAISHGWHFNALRSHLQRTGSDRPTDIAETTSSSDATHGQVADGRPGEPWIWTDDRTGTQLPLSYRNWPGRFNPADIGLTAHQMTVKFGARLPGGGVGEGSKRDSSAQSDDDNQEPTRWPLTGDLEIDCLVCHAVTGTYDFESRRDTIDDEAFAWAATAALRLGTIKGGVSRIKTGSDPADDKVAAKLPRVTYDASRFLADGKVFVDLVRQPENNACYQCHSQRVVGDDGIEARWVHDDDVHLRAGMACTDCHRNGIGHETVRGYLGEQHVASSQAATLSCSGCHLGGDDGRQTAGLESLTRWTKRPGRVGSPLPGHNGLPPTHFEKLSCVACHGGIAPADAAKRLMTSLAHELGSGAHRSGNELPSIAGPVYAPAGFHHETESIDSAANHPAGKPVTTQRVMWPAYWGKVVDGNVSPLSPADVYDATRRALRVRKGFVEELTSVRLSTKDKQAILGDERGKAKEDEWTDQEREKVDAELAVRGQSQFDEKVHAALQALREELGVEQAVYVSTGTVFAQGDKDATLKRIEVNNPDAVGMIAWPMAHNVRPAGWSLGSGGCLDCHSEGSSIFASTVTPVGPVDVEASPINMATLQGLDPEQTLRWNQLFAGRGLFKVMTAASLTTLAVVMLVGIGGAAARLRLAQSTLASKHTTDVPTETQA
ncbi:MAG: hypothetical protein AAGA03_11835 [Planctomycetota bacterium]